MKIDLTKAEFKKLLEVCFLSDWILSAYRTDHEDFPFILSFKQLEQKVFSQTEKFEFGDLVEWDSQGKEYTTTEQHEELMDGDEGAIAYVKEFENALFWDELSQRLARRDIVEQVGEDTYLNMDPFERFRFVEELTGKYAHEFLENGLKNLRISLDDN